jgi:hypothetical protein
MRNNDGEILDVKLRVEISKIILDMLHSSSSHGPVHYVAKLEDMVLRVRYEAIGWMHAEACGLLDEGIDLRKHNVNVIITKARKELS